MQHLILDEINVNLKKNRENTAGSVLFDYIQFQFDEKNCKKKIKSFLGGLKSPFE